MDSREIVETLRSTALAADLCVAENFKDGLLLAPFYHPVHEFEVAHVYGNGRGDIVGCNEIVSFNTGDVESKWGFGDGDVLHDLYLKWADSRGWGSGAGVLYNDMSSHILLWAVWNRFLLPASGLSGKDVDQVTFWGTAHNPLRAVGVYTGKSLAVEIGTDKILDLADEIFEPRRGLYISLYQAFSFGGANSVVVRDRLISIFEPVIERVPGEVRDLFFSLIQSKDGETPMSFTQALTLTAGSLGW